MNNLLIIGAGEHGMVAKETAESMNIFDKIDFLDDNVSFAIGKFEDYIKFIDDYKNIFVALGNTNLRLNWIEKLSNTEYDLVNLIHDKSYVSKSVKLDDGIIIEAGAIVNSNAVIEKGVIISIGALVDHNAYIESGCHIRAGATIKPNSKVCANKIINENEVV